MQRPQSKRRTTRANKNTYTSSKVNARPANNQPYTDRVGHLNPMGRNIISSTERVETVVVPANAQAGDLLFVLENNPQSAPISGEIISQFTAWNGDTEIHLESTGNALAKNYVACRHLPNGDRSLLPNTRATMINLAEASARPNEAKRLQLDSNRVSKVTAPFKTVTFNAPHKPIFDSDPSERNAGLYIIVANGSPGPDPVEITVRYKYEFHLSGPVQKPRLPNLSGHISTLAGTTPAAPLGTARVQDGPGIISSTSNSIVVGPGSYVIVLGSTGTGFTGPGVITSSSGTLTSDPAIFVTTGYKSVYYLVTEQQTTLTIGALPATTVSLTTVTVAPYDLLL